MKRASLCQVLTNTPPARGSHVIADAPIARLINSTLSAHQMPCANQLRMKNPCSALIKCEQNTHSNSMYRFHHANTCGSSLHIFVPPNSCHPRVMSRSVPHLTLTTSISSLSPTVEARVLESPEIRSRPKLILKSTIVVFYFVIQMQLVLLFFAVAFPSVFFFKNMFFPLQSATFCKTSKCVCFATTFACTVFCMVVPSVTWRVLIVLEIR